MPPRSPAEAAPRSAAGPDEGYRPDPRRWHALSVTLVVGFMSLLDVSIVSVALPSLQSDLGATPATVQWVVSGYALTFGLALVPAGRLGDALGRRRLFLAGLAGFVLASAAAGAAPSIGWLVAARLVQGLAAGCLAPQNSAFIQQLFRGAERGRAFGLFGATVGISTAVGPVAGGAILGLASGPDGWRWLFYVNVPIGVVAFLLALRLLPRGGSGGRGRIDVVGVLLLGAGALAVLFPLVQAEAGGLSRLWWLFAVGVALLGAFVAWERRVVARDGQPVFDPRLVTQTRGYGIGAALGTVYFVGFSGIWLVLALFFQTGLGYTPLQSGLAVTPFALGSASSAVVAGRLVERYGRRLTVLGLVTVIAGLAAAAGVLLLVPPSAAGWAIAPALLLGGVGGGLVISPNITMTLRDVPVAMAGAAGGGLQTAQRFGAAVGTAALPGLFYLVLGATGDDYPVAAASGLAVSVLGAAAALVLGVVDLRRNRAGDRDGADRAAGDGGPVPGERHGPDGVHSHGHAWHG
ncbi:drug resistance transporter, EmrB/QacA subfamily [Geodermatophilus saharensis]|uniref:Drug resistance transporter, EmrB/QacA subfamily n=1 Tax=Geodermatophilus saharensis TaxID=1137994 RepID=A0A239CMP3_9ACTN|nr:MFS transporter [Geodermatophilus saharensis]SNS21417.1 drug resistance transporter, EmrB/QacA subfamily [Geodermatophilus saharensis]